MRVREVAANEARVWDDYVASAPTAILYHRFAWREVIAATFGHRPVYLMAEDEAGVRGVLPLVVLKTGLFGTMAVSLPFLNAGGVAASDEAAARALLDAAARIGRENGCAYVEFRHRFAVPGADELPTNTFKETAVLDLTAGAEDAWKRIHQNVRNKIRKAQKNEVTVVGGPEHLGAFYHVFATNQRDHGTPVLPRRFFAAILERFGDDARIFAAYRQGRCLGAKLTVDFAGQRYFIWSASYREANAYAPVPAMNWAAIEDAAARGMTRIDFGRSTKGSTSQDFKKYWAVEMVQLYWQYHLLGRETMPGLNTSNPKFAWLIGIWRKLPVALTKIIGPPLARRLP